MHPTHSDQFVSHRSEQERRNQRGSGQMTAQLPVDTRRVRTEDSWIEISSQDSSTSLHSQGHNDIVTTGLSVRLGGRQLRPNHIRSSPPVRSHSLAGSSQDEYEESESESDRVMSSSNEDIAQQIEDDIEDDQATALGLGQRNVFTPQPNAFSHPPTLGETHSTPAPDSYFPPIPQTSFSDRLPSNRIVTQQTITQRPIRRAPPSSSRIQPDHDAVLRASLTTLLSCAAAVRSPKDRETTVATRPSIQPTTLRLVQGSELDDQPRSSKAATKRRSRESSKERHAKKIRAMKAQPINEEMVSPTVMTWMISAGVVLVFSAISFSAGYAWGKEAGRIEAELGLTSGNCTSEALNAGAGLRKIRWSAAAQSIRA